eukprot:TRINITY_DN3058_c1_g8_i1.p1 TRINITY_DN3058_c1_g8~~TRINITY_DN3058_c1_g8_i1.p1  ORF type:complete len:416 (-),score=80.25 TRINITY_DN3058_c1_g8_i1:152-1399(-)
MFFFDTLNMSDNSNKEFVRKYFHERIPKKIVENSRKEIDINFFGQAFDCCYSPNGEYFVICGFEYVYVVNVKTEKLCYKLSDHVLTAHGIAFSQNEQMMATCSTDMTVIIYDTQDFSVLKRLANNAGIYGICFSRCSNYIYSGDMNGKVKKWDIKNGNIVLEKKVHFDWIWRVELSSDNTHLLSGSYDNTAQLINTQNFSVVHTFRHDSHVRAIAFHPTKNIIATGDEFYQIKLWNMDDGSPIHSFEVEGQVWALSFLSPNILVIMSTDGFIVSFGMDNFQTIQKIPSSCQSSYISLAISPNKTQLACGTSENDLIMVFSIASQFDSTHKTELVDMSRDSGQVLSTIISQNLNTQIIRQLVAAGVCMNEEEYNMIVDTSWDLIDVNKINGGNMHSFINEKSDNSDESDNSDNDDN